MQRCFLYGEAFAQRNFYTNKLLHRETFSHSKLLHTEAFTYTMATEIAALRPDPGAKAKKIKKKNILITVKIEKNLVKSHRRNFDAATPIRFTTLSCRRQCYYARGRSSKKHVCSHPTATAKTEFQSTIELRAMATEIAAPKGYKRHCNAFCNTRFQNNIVQETCATHPSSTTVRTTPRVEASPHPPHKGASLQRQHQPLSTKKTMFLAPASLPKQVSCNIYAGITMQSAQCKVANPNVSTHICIVINVYVLLCLYCCVCVLCSYCYVCNVMYCYVCIVLVVLFLYVLLML